MEYVDYIDSFFELLSDYINSIIDFLKDDGLINFSIYLFGCIPTVVQAVFILTVLLLVLFALFKAFKSV